MACDSEKFPQTDFLHPNPYQNSEEFSLYNRKECSNSITRSINMEKFKEIVIKLANNFPNKPLSETQKSIIQDRLNGLLSVHTPDHPPYSWMIERALQELNEEGGSSEESISEFIRKEYDDLPWSHFTLLKHYLQTLCDCGNIILTRGQRYLLAGGDATGNLCKKSRRKQTRRKQDSDQEIKLHKRHNRDIYKESTLQKEDQIHEKRNCMIEGPKQQSLKAEAIKDTTEEDGEQIDGNQTKLVTPERPPGFDKESYNFPVSCPENHSQGTHPVTHSPEVVTSAAEGSSGQIEKLCVFNANLQLNHEEEQMILAKYGTPETSIHQMLQNVQQMPRTNDIDLQQKMNEENPAKPSPENLAESDLTESNAAISETKPVDLTDSKKVPHLDDNTIDNQVLPIQSAHPSCAEHKSEAITGVAEGPAVSSRLSICSKQPSGFQARKFSELGASDVEESLPTPRMQRQEKRRCRQLLNLKRSQPEHQAPVEFSRVTKQQANLCTQVKENAAPPTSVLASSVGLKQADPREFNKLTSLKMHPDIEPQNQAPKHPPEKRVSQGKTPCRVLRPRPLKPEQSNAQSTVGLSPSCGQHDVQQQLKCCRRSPVKVKPESGIISDEWVFFPDHFPRQKLHKHRGRPPKHELGVRTRIHKELVSGAQQHTPTKRGRGRPRKEQEGEYGCLPC